MKKIKKTTSLNILIIFIYLALPFVFFRGMLEINKVFFGVIDVPSYTIPLRELTIKFLKNFDFPFWNSYIFNGFPLSATPQAFIFYPITLLLDLFFPITLSYNLSLLLHYSFAGIFLYLFLTEYKLSKLSCFVGGLIFMFSGVMITHRSHPQIIFPIVWFPLILFFIEKYRKSKRFEFVLLASIFYSIAFLGSHTQIFVLGTIVLIFYIIYYFLIYSKSNYKTLLKLLLIFPITILIICIQLIPSIELTLKSVRETLSYNSFVEYSFEPKMVLAIFFPFIYGSQYPALNIPQYFGPFIYVENMIYFGISTIVLLLISFFSKNKHKYFWIFILLFSVFLVFGKYNPLYKFLYYIPIYNKFRIPARNWFEFGLAFSVLAAIGFDYFLKNKKINIKKAVIISVSSVTLIISGILFLLYSLKYNLFSKVHFIFKRLGVNDLELENFFNNISVKKYAIIIPIIITIIIVLIFLVSLIKKNKFIYGFLIILIVLDLFSFGYYYEGNINNSYINASFNNYEDLKFLESGKKNFRIFSNIYYIADSRIIPNMNIHYDLYSIGGYDSLILKDYNYMTKIPNNPASFESSIEILKNNLVISKLNTKYIILRKPEDLNNFLDSINQIYYTKEYSKLIADESKYEKAGLKNIEINESNEIIFNGKDNSLKLFQIPVSLKEETGYLIKFKIKKISEIDNFLIIDFFGINYDNPEQETEIYNRDIKGNFTTILKLINTNKIPSKEDLYLRFFTFAKGEFVIKDIEIFEVSIKKENSYGIIYDDGYYIILENKNVKDRFYFSTNIKNVKNIEEVHSIFWDLISFSEKNYIYNTDFVEGIDVNRKNFNINNTTIDILDYEHNYIRLETETNKENFLVFSDTYYPGWRAYINGLETEIYRVNGVVKGIFVPEGKNHIVFLFRPTYFFILLIISLVSLVTVIFFIIKLFLKNRRIKKIKF